MAKGDLKELKGLHNNDFYPEHYLNSALADDAKSNGFDGKAIKDLRKVMEPKLQTLSEDNDPATRNYLIDTWFKTLGFTDHDGDSNKIVHLPIRNKEYQFNVFKSFDLRTEGQLWLLRDDGKGLSLDFDSDAAVVTLPSRTDRVHSRDQEHFYQNGIPLRLKDEEVMLPWRDVISSIFDSDTSAAEWLIINQGDRLLLLEKERWQTTEGYLAIDVTELFEVNADESYRVVQSLISLTPFAIDSAESFHDKVAKNAHRKATEVTKALRDTVRESIEIIANEILEQHKHAPLPSLKAMDLNTRDGRTEAAQDIFDQTLRYIYRMLFMFFTESQDQKKGALPVQSRAYQMGYAIEKLRDLEGITLQNASNNFIQQTLHQAFRIYFDGYHSDRLKIYNPHMERDELETDALGFSFPQLGTDLFDPKKTTLLQEVTLRDGPMQEVLRKLSLARVGSGKKIRTHRVHYAGLGLNQLGAVYEGLLSLKPEILAEKVTLLKKEAKEPAHRYVPSTKQKDYSKDDLAADDEGQVITRGKGEFILTPVGLERKFSASFYTPEVLTRFLAKEAVDTLLGDNPSIERMENLRICEPAMGSGAFLNAVVDEIAPRMAQHYRKVDYTAHEAYRKQCETKGKVFTKQDAPPLHEMSHYISMAKDHLMTHCVYGVDLNATAVELAKISLWLNCLHEDGNLPFLDFKLKHGNSLVGCWVSQPPFRVGDKQWHHFLLPPPSALDAHLDGKVLGKKDRPFIENPTEKERVQKLKKDWQDCGKSPEHQARLDKLTQRIDKLYQSHLKRRHQMRQDMIAANTVQEKSEIFKKFVRENTAYNQIRSMMDYWCALWFWTHSKIKELPSTEGYLTALEWMAEVPLAYERGEREKQIKESGLRELLTAREIALENNFFHWDLEFAEVFADGGFDLVLGNPPWAPVRWEEADFFEMVQPGIHGVKEDAKGRHKAYEECLERDKSLVPFYKDANAKVTALAEFLKASGTYPFEDKSNTNTYRYFYQRFYSVTRKDGIHAMIAQDGILSDEGCVAMRPTFYNELSKMYRFINYLMLFEDVAHLTKYTLWFCRKGQNNIHFQIIDNLYHPDTIEKCRKETAQAPYRGMKDSLGEFELRGHPARIVTIDKDALSSLAQFGDGKWDTVNFPIIHGQIELGVLQRLAGHTTKLKDRNWTYWRRINETGATKEGLITRKPGQSKTIAHAVMTGPNIFVGHPARKNPNPGCKSHGDYSEVDLTTTPIDFFPDTVYQATEKVLKSTEYNSPTPWGTIHTQEPRIIARLMVNITGVRTLSSALIPPGPSHVDALVTLSFKDHQELVYTSGLFHSLIYDFLMRSISSGNIGQGIYNMTPTLTPEQLKSPLVPALMVRALRLSCISNHYADLWKEVYRPEFNHFTIASTFGPKMPYKDLSPKWQRDTCIREWRQREQALCEIDAIVAILFDFDKDTLLNLYRSQFGVLQKDLQDLPNQKEIDAESHFPRYAAMTEAYDQFQTMKNGKKSAA